MIPEHRATAVSAAFEITLGTPHPDAIEQLASGPGSDLLFRISNQCEQYQLLVMPQVSEILNATRRFACMKMAAEAGVAPSVLYQDVDNGICLTRAPRAVPLTADRARMELPRLLATLHALPLFPSTFNYATAWMSVQRFRNANLLPLAEYDEVFPAIARLAETYPLIETDMVSCHMDVKPDTVVFDGTRIWLCDWKAAFVNDRYYDLAVAAHLLVSTDDEEHAFLHQYFGRIATEYEHARFFLMRQLVNTLAASLYLLFSSQGKPIVMNALAAPPHLNDWEHPLPLEGNEAMMQCGASYWNALKRQVQRARFNQSLELVSRRHQRGPVARLLPRAGS